jgi:hypothetical protein
MEVGLITVLALIINEIATDNVREWENQSDRWPGLISNLIQRIRRFGLPTRKLRRGCHPDDFKPMSAIGKGVEEIRVSDESGAAMPAKDIDVAKRGFRQIAGGKIKKPESVWHGIAASTEQARLMMGSDLSELAGGSVVRYSGKV